MSFAIATLHDAIAGAIPEREALVFGDLRLTWAEVAERTNRLANVLLAHGVTIHTERHQLGNSECGQDTVALYMLNGNEYLEGMLGAFKARAVGVNVNYRYVAEELEYLLRDAGTQAVIYHRRFAPVLREVLDRLPPTKLLLEVDDGSDEAPLTGALDYESALAGAAPDSPPTEPSPDDLYLLYTGGTTGMPKGVLWRQADSVIAQLGGRDAEGSALPSVTAFVDRAVKAKPHRVLAIPPFMHGAGSYAAFNAWMNGGTVIIQSKVDGLDAASVLDAAAGERAKLLVVIGDAFGQPLLDEARRTPRDLGSVRAIFNTGALLTDGVKAGLLEIMPNARILDGLGSSESGPQAVAVSTASGVMRTGEFLRTPECVVMNEALTGQLEPGHEGLGWLAKCGSVPLGYLGDEARTRKTFPLIDGVRYVIGGDRVRLAIDGTVHLHGRESFTINSGGEKIFVEEVELALKAHPDVRDVLVTNRPSQRWGQEVVAVIQTRNGSDGDREALLAEAARHIARYKLPKAFRFVPTIQRAANGKPDYQWAYEAGKEAT